MTTTQSRFFDELAKLMTNAAGAAQGVRREIDTQIQAQMERVLGNMELVTRDEFEAVRAMAQKAREENETLHQRIVALEARISPGSAESPSEAKAD
jgi:BMFP domain-containing protein YqiC